MLPDGEEVGEDLGGVELVGQAIPHRHTGVVGQLFHDALAVAAVLDAVEHPAQHPGGVGDGLLFADLAARRVEVGDFHAQVVGGDLKAAAGAGGGLLEDEAMFLPCRASWRMPAFFFAFRSAARSSRPSISSGV